MNCTLPVFGNTPTTLDKLIDWVKIITDYLDPKRVIEIVSNTLKIDKKLFSKRYRNGIARGILSELLYRYSGLKELDIGEFCWEI